VAAKAVREYSCDGLFVDLERKIAKIDWK